MVGRSADVISQPGAQPGQRTYCPVSGVVFKVTSASPHREVDGKPFYFCCEACAAYFSQNEQRVFAMRSWTPRPASEPGPAAAKPGHPTP